MSKSGVSQATMKAKGRGMAKVANQKKGGGYSGGGTVARGMGAAKKGGSFKGAC